MSVYLRPNLSSTNVLTQVVTSRCKSTQVDGQTKRKFSTSPKLASTCESVWPGLKSQLHRLRNYLQTFLYFLVKWKCNTRITVSKQCNLRDGREIPFSTSLTPLKNAGSPLFSNIQCSLLWRRANARNVSQHTLYGVQHIHINFTLIHCTFYHYAADADQN